MLVGRSESLVQAEAVYGAQRCCSFCLRWVKYIPPPRKPPRSSYIRDTPPVPLLTSALSLPLEGAVYKQRWKTHKQINKQEWFLFLIKMFMFTFNIFNTTIKIFMYTNLCGSHKTANWITSVSTLIKYFNKKVYFYYFFKRLIWKYK